MCFMVNSDAQVECFCLESVTDLESLWKTIAIQGSIYEELDYLDKFFFLTHMFIYKRTDLCNMLTTIR